MSRQPGRTEALKNRAGRLALAALPAALAALLALAAAPARAENHALIMWIGEYAVPQAHLPGIAQDAALARKIAHGMGVADANIVELNNEALALDSIRAAIGGLAGRIADGDKVFLYYSGHGGQVNSPDGQARCMEGLLTYDAKLYDDRLLRDDLRHLAERASQVIVMNDSCFSGGEGELGGETASKGLSDAGAKPKGMSLAKLWGSAGATTPAACGDAVNKVAQSLALAGREHGTQVLYIAAAAENELSWATRQGSVATAAWASCVDPLKADYDHSGVVNGEELRRCAQDRIDRENDERHQTITLHGNAALPLSFAALASVDKRLEVVPVDLSRALEDVRAGSDSNIRVELKAATTTLTIGADMLDFSVSTSRDGYLYLLQVGSDGQAVNLLFPNREDADNYVSAGAHRFPRANWQLRAAGPAGTSRFLAILSPVRKDIGRGMDQTGVFASAPATAGQTKSLVVEASGARAGGTGRFGASEVLAIREVR